MGDTRERYTRRETETSASEAHPTGYGTAFAKAMIDHNLKRADDLEAPASWPQRLKWLSWLGVRDGIRNRLITAA